MFKGNLSRRDLLTAGAVASASALLPRVLWAAEARGRWLSGVERFDGPAHILRFDPSAKEAYALTEVRSAVHSFIALSGSRVAAVPKQKEWLSVFDFRANRLVRELRAPEGLVFNGHALLMKDRLWVSAVDAADVTYVPARTRSGYVLVYKLSDFSLEETRPSFGYGPHDMRVLGAGTVLVANVSGEDGKSELVTVDAKTGEVRTRAAVPAEMQARHLRVDADGTTVILTQCRGDKVTGVALGWSPGRSGGNFEFYPVSTEGCDQSTYEREGDFGYLSTFGGEDKSNLIRFDYRTKRIEKLRAPPSRGLLLTDGGLLLLSGSKIFKGPRGGELSAFKWNEKGDLNFSGHTFAL